MSVWFNPKSMSSIKTVSVEGGDVVFSGDKGENRIPLSDITKITSERSTPLSFFHHNKTMVTFSFSDEQQRDDCFRYFEERGFRATEARQTPFKAASCSGCGALVVAIFTGLFYMAAKDLAAGEEATTRGRHQLLKKIVAWLIDLIGPTGVIVVGVILIGLLLMNAVKSARNPPVEITLIPAD